jgi:hypothetical protein
MLMAARGGENGVGGGKRKKDDEYLSEKKTSFPNLSHQHTDRKTQNERN